MYSPGQVLKQEPAVVSAAVVAVVNLAVLLGLDLTPEQVAGINLALTSLLGLFYVRPRVTPTDPPPA